MTTRTENFESHTATAIDRPPAGIPNWLGFGIAASLFWVYAPIWLPIALPFLGALIIAGRVENKLKTAWLLRLPERLAWGTATLGVLIGVLYSQIIPASRGISFQDAIGPRASLLLALAALSTAATTVSVLWRGGGHLYWHTALSLGTGKWVRATGWLFVLIGKLAGYAVALVLGSIGETQQPPQDDRDDPHYVRHARWDDERCCWLDSRGSPAPMIDIL